MVICVAVVLCLQALSVAMFCPKDMGVARLCPNDVDVARLCPKAIGVAMMICPMTSGVGVLLCLKAIDASCGVTSQSDWCCNGIVSRP